VLAHVPGHLQHVDARHREDRLQRRIGLDGTSIVQLVALDVNPNLLRHLRARKRLRTADGPGQLRHELPHQGGAAVVRTRLPGLLHKGQFRR